MADDAAHADVTIPTIADVPAVVLGAGISGLVSASVLVQQGATGVVVADEFSHIGGNHIDCGVGPYTFDVGSFIFQDDSPLLRHFPEMLPLYVPIDPSWGKLSPQGVIAPYPLSIRTDILQSGLIGCAGILLSALKARLFHRKIGNARDFARFWIGDRLLTRSGLESYMRRFFGVRAERVDLQFARKRMMWIEEHASLRSALRHLRPRPPSRPANRQLARPREGFGRLYEAAAQRLREKGVRFHLGTPVTEIRRSGEDFLVTVGGSRYRTKRVISTIPIDHAIRICALDVDPQLSSVELISLFFSFSGRRGFEQSILYNFAHGGAWKRLTVYSDFYGRANEREYFGVEVIADQVGGSIAAAEEDFRRHVASNALFVGDLALEGSRKVPNAYPVYVNQAGVRVDKALAALHAFGVESFGRQGAFNYQPTARVSTIEAEAALGSRAPAVAGQAV